jgi:predicted transglutaminase-like cysteine proteinase
MSVLGKRSVSRRVVSLLAIALATTSANAAYGKTRNKLALQPVGGAAFAVPAASVPDLPSPAPSQYFTINDILKKRAEPLAPRGPVRLASVDPVGLRGSIRETWFTDKRARSGDAPFGLVTFRAPEGLLWVKWRKVEMAVNKDADLLSRCRAEPDRCPSTAARRFASVIEDVAVTHGRARLETVNRLVNTAIRYTSDFAQHGEADVWSPPLASFATGRGDCEDYAIAKYMALREVGTPAEDLQILLAIDRSAGEPHAVLAARHHGAWFILDNRRPMIAEDSEISYFTPLFVIDQQGVKLLSRPYRTASSDKDVMPRVSSVSTSSAPASESQTELAGNDVLITVPDEL